MAKRKSVDACAVTKMRTATLRILDLKCAIKKLWKIYLVIIVTVYHLILKNLLLRGGGTVSRIN